MITLYNFGPNLGVADPSPFCLKVDLYMRMADVPFEVASGTANLRKAPKGKLPFLEEDGRIIADSFFIQKYLQKEKGADLDAWLDDEQRALAHLVAKSLDENLYWCLVHSRWIGDDTWPLINATFFGSMPVPLKYIVPLVARKGVKTALKNHGMGRHSDAEILQIAEKSLKSLSALLADKDYFMGAQPCSLDAAAFGLLAQMILVTLDNPLNSLARRFDNLVEYCRRMGLQYYGTG